ncbi:hypothetical protein M885DRAFT_574852, partial [Pelagophyceae sp. CCMP2097]
EATDADDDADAGACDDAHDEDDFEVHEPDYDAFTDVYIDRVHPLDRSADATANLRGSTHADADGRPPGKMMPLKTESYDEDDDADASAYLRAAPGAPHGNCTPASATRDGNQHTRAVHAASST